MPNPIAKINKLVRLSFVVLLFAATSSSPSTALRAQRARESSVRAISIATRTVKHGTAVTIYADTPLTRTQTWKDDEGFHIVLPDAGQSLVKKSPRGVKVRRVGRSLEILIQTEPQADVRVQPLFNRLTLFVSGELDVSRKENFELSTVQEPCPPEIGGSGFNQPFPCDRREPRSAPSKTTTAQVNSPPVSQPEQLAAVAPSTTVPLVASSPASVSTTRQTYAPSINSWTSSWNAVQQETAQSNGKALTPAQQSIPQTNSANVPTIAYDDESDLPQSKVEVKTDPQGGFLSTIFSPVGALVFLGPGVLLFLFFRQRRSAHPGSLEANEPEMASAATLDEEDDIITVSPEELSQYSGYQTAKSGNKKTARTTAAAKPLELTLEGPEPAQSVASTNVLAAAYGTERIKETVSKLVKGLPYSSDILSSRAADDRRAAESFLMKALSSPELKENERTRVRRALEEHGFVLRRGAVLLSAADVAERASAARTLAEMRTPTSMPFLLEALYDAEANVRAEAISGIGALKNPSAISALLGVALRHPETPASLLGSVLSACSVEPFNDFPTWDEASSTPKTDDLGVAEQTKELALLSNVEYLPESLDDENLVNALTQLEDADENVRVVSARSLGQFRVRRAVRALTSIALHDASAGVRAAAVASLGSINHESVFGHLLIAFSDEAREVQAAAARALSRLNIDRTEAYARLLETADETTLRDVAQSCIKKGLVSQAVDKLTSPDRRLAHESYLLLSLLSQLKDTEALSDAIERCPDSNARLAAAGLFGLTHLLKADSPAL